MGILAIMPVACATVRKASAACVYEVSPLATRSMLSATCWASCLLARCCARVEPTAIPVDLRMRLPFAQNSACQIPFLSFVSAMLCSMWLLGVRVTRVTGM